MLIRKGLTTQFGVSVKTANKLVNSPKVLLRWYEAINGVMDSLILADPTIFLEDLRPLKRLVRKITNVSTSRSGVSAVVSMWKDFTNWYFHTAAQTDLIGGELTPLKGNVFTKLLGVGRIRTWMVRGKWEDFKHIAHICSTRQMPFCGEKTVAKAIAEFREVITSTFEVEPAMLLKVRLAARRIGGICRSIGPKTRGADHLSVSSSGSLRHPIRSGGNAAAVVAMLERHVTEVSDSDWCERTPFGIFEHESGIPLWMSILGYESGENYLSTDYHNRRRARIETLRPYKLGEIIPGSVGTPVKAGYDDNLGLLILYSSWKDCIMQSSIPTVRVSTVPEPGNKARIITVSDCWVNALMAPFCHLLKSSMKCHPSVWSSFNKSDQNWESLKILMNGDTNPLTLSSDLKNATNAIPFTVARELVIGFCEGHGLRIGPYRALVIGLIGTRYIEIGEDHVFSNRGVLMGEAIAKPVLTLLNLVVEEISYYKFHNKELDWKAAPKPDGWKRAVHIGGDDHVVRGPKRYLDLITETHLSVGSMVSPGKHGISAKAVRYTEKVLFVENFKYGVRYRDIQEDALHLTPAVDTVKVRLLTKSQSTIILKDDKNAAIGKAFQLMRTLVYLPDHDPTKRNARDLFLSRMAPLLPTKHKSGKLWHLMHLPRELGGLSLAFDNELEYHFRRSPAPIKAIIHKMMSDVNCREESRILSKLISNPSARGIPSLMERTEALRRAFEEGNFSPLGVHEHVLENIPLLSWFDVKDRIQTDRGENAFIVRKLKDEGVVTHHDFIKEWLRSDIFMALMSSDTRKPRVFETIPYSERYMKVRKDILKLTPESAWEFEPLSYTEVFDRYKMAKTIFVDLNSRIRDFGENKGLLTSEYEKNLKLAKGEDPYERSEDDYFLGPGGMDISIDRIGLLLQAGRAGSLVDSLLNQEVREEVKTLRDLLRRPDRPALIVKRYE